MVKLYRVFGLLRVPFVCGGRSLCGFVSIRELYFSSLDDALQYIRTFCVGYWEIWVGDKRVARSAVPEDI